ncbi:glycine--tRNA ligase subunit beta [Hyphomicrobium sp. xq]|uniref:Glycine--tRNA ligase beta subunit n=1 Tax=Hyphomicrobium album TaxID=2665159 RepID=A0A6I3KNM5_9HYPH|nr:glycine--tRNA ligase subunit beta [Hyphomicrobium album]MTD95347.1 glycine--tRNA ligase subunit beta [Hyphomicrobium album]
MSELLLELFSEEIPARLQVRAAEDLRRLMVDGLTAKGLEVGEARAFATPRRLALVIADVPKKSPAVSEEKKGPRVGAPEQAIAGFLKGAGLKAIGEASVVKDEKKGDYYVARIDKPGRAAGEIVNEVLRETILNFPWPKTMRFNAKLDNGAELRWIRPLHAIVLLLDGKVVAFEIAGIKSGATTRGHRFMGNEPFKVTGFADYEKQLKANKVVLDSAARSAAINEAAHAAAKDAHLTLVEDDALAAENAGLTEWPTVLMGAFDKSFLAVPGECLTSAMKTHQKCFSLRHGKKLSNHFLLVTNLKAKDGGKTIVAGNEKVIAARLSDAKFFWETDLKKSLDQMRDELKGITFHEKLGTQFERTERIKEMAHQLATSQELCEAALALRAGELSKADLVSGMVGEFPELQGLMGRYYAEAEHMNPAIARAIELHYKPKGPTDSVPLESEGDGAAVAVALADKLDMLVGFWAIGEKPTGSGDPYQLRRAALGVIRLVIDNELRLPLRHTFVLAQGKKKDDAASNDLLAFFAERLKVYLRDKGARHDLIDAIISLPGQDDLALIVKRVEALTEFLKTDDGANLLAGVKRAQNILTIEEKKDKTSHAGDYDAALLQADEEEALAAAIDKVKDDTVAALAVENFAGSMRALAELRAPVDAFFDKVTVNADDPALRQNRLHLLSQIRAATLNVADFTKIAG